MIAGSPARPGPVPEQIRALAAGRPVRQVWQNEAGGVTYEVGEGGGRCFATWAPAASGIDLARAAARLSWAAAFTPVPRLLAHGADDGGSWLVTAALPGDNAVADRWRADPSTAVTAIGEGLRALHESLPVASCPFSWAAEDRVADARRFAASGSLDPAQWHAAHQRLSAERALELAAAIPPADRLVVCHGDSCAPNTLIAPDGRWSGHVDLGHLGVADRWHDIAVAAWSTEWYYGPGWEPLLLSAYGIAPDPGRSRYYRLLWDLSCSLPGMAA
ncbi:MAG TPA: aminoglycoside 3'-phosphotransferase [Streptosporangiaceae bacterium]|jgi:kanamycin kinase|nr:aminoglycoside 3'-phosphotransferase [Streptosporangiaceae bacterium]